MTATPKKRLLLLILTALLALVPGGSASAHPADMYLHLIEVSLTPEAIGVTWAISPGAMLAFMTWGEADSDGSGQISADEAALWAAPHIEQLAAIVNGDTPLAWQVEGVDWPTSIADFEMGRAKIEIHLSAAWPAGLTDRHDLLLYNHFKENTSINWFTVTGLDGTAFTVPEQQSGLLSLRVASAGDSDLRTAWDSGTPTLGAGGSASSTQPQISQAASVLTGLVSSEQLSAPFMAAALGIALLLGAIHALTPGHGKALVAAYLVGTRGTARHAAALGGIVTLTHTGSVLAIGLLTLLASQFFVPTSVFPVLEIASGLLIVTMGLGLLRQRWIGWQAVRRARRQASQPAPVPSKTARTIAINQPIAAKEFNTVLPEGDFSVGAISWRSLLALGISGGLVPCPDAIAILLVAVAINRITLGLSLVITFSPGLAVVLIAIGIAMVRSRRLVERFEGLGRVVPALPLASAIIVLGLGVVLTASAASRAGLLGGPTTESAGASALAALGYDRAIPRPFSVEQASVLYSAATEPGHEQLFIVPTSGGEPFELTGAGPAIWTFALSPDGTRVAFSSGREDGGSAIWLVNTDGTGQRRALDCPNASCQNVVWSPDGTRLAYERMAFAAPDSNQLEITTIWWVDADTGETGPIFRDTQLPGFSPRWSGDGRWLSYTSPGTTGMQLYNLEDGRTLNLPTMTGAAALWHPTRSELLMTDVKPVGDLYLTHLLHFDVESGELTDLTGNEMLEDGAAAWSPDGEWIAITRRSLAGGNLSPGNDIWLTRPDGSEVRRVTQTEGILHQTPVWSPDGRYLLVARFTLSAAYPEPQVWLVEMNTGDAQQVVTPGNNPLGLP